MQRRLAKQAHYWVLSVALLFTALGTFAYRGMVQERDLDTFRSSVRATQDRIQRRVETYLAVLLATRSLFEARSLGDLRQFRRYVRRLEIEQRYPGIQGIGFSLKLSREEKANVEQEMRRQGHAGFRVWPEHDRAEYHSIVFLEPLDRRNAAALGYDMFSEPIRRNAMERARDTGAPAASRKVTLVQEIDSHKQAGFLIYVPVYRDATAAAQGFRQNRLVGFVYSPFRMEDLLRGIFAAAENPRVSFQVFDAEAPVPEARMYPHGSQVEPVNEMVRFRESRRLDVAGRRWTLQFRSTPALEAVSGQRFVVPFAAAGLGATLLLFFVTRAQVRARSRAEESEAAAKIARAEAEAQRNNLHTLFTQAPAAIAILRGSELRYELSNPMHEELLGWRDLVGKTAKEAVPELEAQGFLKLAEQVLRTGIPIAGREVPGLVTLADGEQQQKFVNFTYQPLLGAGAQPEGVVAFAYDVTEQVLARQKVEALAEDLKQAVRVRDEFVSVAGHELKTPLATLKLQVQSL
ncbi:MAG TPA: CHASE domain-containing protein, partial [Polyangiaceae bacterium]|nr:CHASE domain-containing protein [Polyangiaceae bacterium]